MKSLQKLSSAVTGSDSYSGTHTASLTTVVPSAGYCRENPCPGGSMELQLTGEWPASRGKCKKSDSSHSNPCKMTHVIALGKYPLLSCTPTHSEAQVSCGMQGRE